MEALTGICIASFIGIFLFLARIMRSMAKLKEQNDRIYEDVFEIENTYPVRLEDKSTLLNIKDLGMSARLFRCLNAAEIKWLEQVTVRTKKEISKYRHLGKKSLDELERLMNEHNLKFKK